jgi:hypothetical protein
MRCSTQLKYTILPPQLGQASKSYPNARRISSAQAPRGHCNDVSQSAPTANSRRYATTRARQRERAASTPWYSTKFLCGLGMSAASLAKKSRGS